ncbi:MAG: aspartate/glutamate racemase family protein [Pseudothermotoga sp.]
MAIVKGGKNIYGFRLGVIMLETHFPRLPGDIGNASTWDFPVLYKTMKKIGVREVIENDPAPFLQEFIEAAKDLEKQGVRVITTSCGFLSIFQDQIAQELNVPFISSALILIPIVHKMIGKKKVGIITANSQALSPLHLQAIGAQNVPIVKVGIEDTEFGKTLLYDRWEIDIEVARKEMIEKAKKLISTDSDIGAIILECTNMPPFARDVRLVTKLPVFDIVNLINFVILCIDLNRSVKTRWFDESY